jgi:predicted hydrolase (HD superfamily)
MHEDLTRNRGAALDLLEEYVQSEALRRHALAVEASVRWYARKAGEDEGSWGCVALLHDFDWEVHPTLERHPHEGTAILAERGYPDWFTRAILSHAHHTGVSRETLLERTLFACDELSGFIHACGLVRPTGLVGLEPKSVRKKLKQPSFAAGVDRDDVIMGAELLDLPLDDHIRNVIAALLPISGDLGLPAA